MLLPQLACGLLAFPYSLLAFPCGLLAFPGSRWWLRWWLRDRWPRQLRLLLLLHSNCRGPLGSSDWQYWFW